MKTATITLTCNDCQGKGHLHATELYRGKRVDTAVPCHTCKGTGTEDIEWVMCPTCGEALCDCPDPVVVEGVAVDAPGFEDGEQLTAFADRAKARGLRTWPSSTPGMVMVTNSRGDGAYAVTRTSCECAGHRSHGRCYHRALCIYLHDIERVPVCALTTIGATAAGQTVTYGRRPAGKVAA